ncbi:hypothetical protein SGFS_073370 [Streptomyces graminofaciens]|jgi:hypothetical protein|uniref:Integral membrane protein n=1 Tax=Streptomyces graminofaciens TaxID=68212 RepID=A0ABM7FI50_9ACTN|nr:hypothetical protein [Streptomyces graminofaciens]BBC36043.1 hypothetical protein SGFS_073370 [Streptomyces graminofaciens]
MSFGDPKNPYGPPPQQQPPAPGYGYPQQTPPQQPGYGYPTAPPVSQGYGGYPDGPVAIPGGVKGARIMLYVLGAFQVIGGVALMVASAWFADYISDSANADGSLSSEDTDTIANFGAGVFIAFGVVALGFAAWGILTATKFSTGGNGIRISAIVYASFVTAFSVVSLISANVFALISLALGILIIVFCSKRDAGQWFNRPRY